MSLGRKKGHFQSRMKENVKEFMEKVRRKKEHCIRFLQPKQNKN